MEHAVNKTSRHFNEPLHNYAAKLDDSKLSARTTKFSIKEIKLSDQGHSERVQL